jgi:hypothetical protein
MPRRTSALAYVVTAVWILHHRELFLVGNQNIGQHFRAFVVNIVIA